LDETVEGSEHVKLYVYLSDLVVLLLCICSVPLLPHVRALSLGLLVLLRRMTDPLYTHSEGPHVCPFMAPVDAAANTRGPVGEAIMQEPSVVP
jgi:hypothetical protein